MAQSFGERLRSLRTRRRLTPSGLAHAVGVTEGAIRQMESGQTKSASFVVGLRLARALGVTAWFLATGEDTGEKAAGTELPALQAVEELTLAVHAIDRRVRTLEGRSRVAKRRTAGD